MGVGIRGDGLAADDGVVQVIDALPEETDLLGLVGDDVSLHLEGLVLPIESERRALAAECRVEA
jgi:hypothetical protein